MSPNETFQMRYDIWLWNKLNEISPVYLMLHLGFRPVQC